MYNDEAIKEQMAGSTAITVLIKDNKLYCANAGDSRAIACRNGALVTLSDDHKPNNPEEMDRIYKAGGWVEFNRVNGNLALSRALGDFLFKRNQTIPAEQQIVTGEIISKANQRWCKGGRKHRACLQNVRSSRLSIIAVYVVLLSVDFLVNNISMLLREFNLFLLSSFADNNRVINSGGEAITADAKVEKKLL